MKNLSHVYKTVGSLEVINGSIILWMGDFLFTVYYLTLTVFCFATYVYTIRGKKSMSKFKNTRKRQDDSNESVMDIINDILFFTIKYAGREDWNISFYNHFRIYKTNMWRK